jgi:hypothetical protein
VAGFEQRRLEEAASNLFCADVRRLCEPDENGVRGLLDELLNGLEAELPAFSNAITNTYFSLAEMERVT